MSLSRWKDRIPLSSSLLDKHLGKIEQREGDSEEQINHYVIGSICQSILSLASYINRKRTKHTYSTHTHTLTLQRESENLLLSHQTYLISSQTIQNSQSGHKKTV